MKRCKNCNKRIFHDTTAKYADHYTWRHYGYAKRECDAPLRLKYAEPKEDSK